MKTRDRVATALAPHEAEAIIEQARRRQRRRRRMIGLELVAVVVVWLVVMSVASGGIWDPFAAQGGARSAGARAAARPPLSGQARVTWRASLGGVLQATAAVASRSRERTGVRTWPRPCLPKEGSSRATPSPTASWTGRGTSPPTCTAGGSGSTTRTLTSPASFSLSCLTRAPCCAAWPRRPGSRPPATRCAAACG